MGSLLFTVLLVKCDYVGTLLQPSSANLCSHPRLSPLRNHPLLASRVSHSWHSWALESRGLGREHEVKHTVWASRSRVPANRGACLLSQGSRLTSHSVVREELGALMPNIDAKRAWGSALVTWTADMEMSLKTHSTSQSSRQPECSVRGLALLKEFSQIMAGRAAAAWIVQVVWP